MTKLNTNTVQRRTNNLIHLSTIVRQFMAVQRATTVDGRSETDGEHTLHLQFLAVSYAAEFHPRLDIGLVSQFALIHDFVEVYANDTPTLLADQQALLEKAVREERALLELRAQLGDAWPYLMNLVDRYEALEDDEARFVRCFDKCDPIFRHLDDRGVALHRLGIITAASYASANDKVRERILDYSAGFEDVLAVREQLQNRVARTVFSEL
ncbi:MAG: HD domain-containing protein [Chloroflexi bacterium]|nr:MAG: HD domain-containing protein [Chloroflexota bacterium]